MVAPDVYVVFGRPKGPRPSYKQWEEANVPMTVVFEVLSPSNSYQELDDKLDFYDRHGVEEYYVLDPDTNRLKIWLRRGSALVRERNVNMFDSPRLGARFDMSSSEITIYAPNGQRFLTPEEMESARAEEKQRADQEKQRADRLQRIVDLVERRAPAPPAPTNWRNWTASMRKHKRQAASLRRALPADFIAAISGSIPRSTSPLPCRSHSTQCAASAQGRAGSCGCKSTSAPARRAQ
jgi:Putative restriction endonuclease